METTHDAVNIDRWKKSAHYVRFEVKGFCPVEIWTDVPYNLYKRRFKYGNKKKYSH